MITIEEMTRKIAEEDVEFIRLQFTDAFGHLKNIAVTTSQLERLIRRQFSFAGMAMFDNRYPLDEELYLYPDVSTFSILPWRPQQRRVAKVICDVCREDGSLYAMSPRTILKRTIALAEAQGYRFHISPACEFYLFHLDEDGRPTTITHESAGYLDVGPLDYGENARRDIVLALEEVGFVVESSYHEASPAQHEIDFGEASSLQSADALVSFAFTVRSIAKRAGLHATFMPKPLSKSAGSGLHLSIAIEKDGVPLDAAAEAEPPQEIRSFLAGMERHARAMCAVTNPIVNSYKRLRTLEQDAPFARYRRRHGEGRVELRFPDPSANPYLAIALAITAGLDGVEKRLEQHGEKTIAALPTHLGESLAALRQDSVLCEALGQSFVQIYSRVKEEEWQDYLSDVSPWEIERYLCKI